MDTIKTIYKVGMGPSSSHTMGPNRAALKFKESVKSDRYRVTLYGSLAATGKGHLTDFAIISALKPAETEIIWKPEQVLPFHPNGMYFEALDSEGNVIKDWQVFSIGGGELAEPEKKRNSDIVYPHMHLTDIRTYCKKKDLLLYEYVERFEGKEIWDYLHYIWGVMQDCIRRGLNTDGRLPGILRLPRKARFFYQKIDRVPSGLSGIVKVCSYALACSEENGGGGTVVTAPTCGSCGVLPAVLYEWSQEPDVKERDILRAMATAALIGNVTRTNASISGAEVGCQGEVGVACAMAAAAMAQLMEPAALSCIEYAAEMGIEHHLGLTCDPIAGLVQIPCIERNGMAALRARTCAVYSIVSGGRHRIRFDSVIRVMKETGLDLKACYRETSAGGLADGEISAIR